MNFFTRFDCRPSHILYRFRFKLYDGYRESKVYTIIFPAIDNIDASYLIDKYVQSPNMEHISLMSLNVATYNIAFFNYFEFPIIEDFKEEFINSISIDEELQLKA